MRLTDKERLDRAIKLLDENKIEEAKDLLQLIKDSNHGFFRITAITKEDIIGEFESKYGRTSKKALRVKHIVKNLSDDEMEWFACELADSYLEMLFWDDVKFIFEERFLDEYRPEHKPLNKDKEL